MARTSKEAGAAGLDEYRRKRDFSRTPEPSGAVKERKASRLLYVVHKHAASRLHYDLRLELDGVLKSWAVPKGPSLNPQEKHLAVQVEDHPLDYGSFEGIIPEGEYGGGTVMLWDRGTWEPEDGDPRRGLEKGRLKFRLHGEKLRGSWALVRMSGESGEGGKNWLLLKHADEEARSQEEVDRLKETSPSVATGRTMEEIAAAADAVWSSREDSASRKAAEEKPRRRRSEKSKEIDPAALPNARRAKQPEKFRPQLATLVEEPPGGREWLHEVKFDGYRIVCLVRNQSARLLTRNGHDWTDKFPQIAAAAARLPMSEGILDGEVVVLRPDGTSDFQALQNILEGVQKGTLVYYVFDLPFFQGYDLTRTPLLKRKEVLEKIMARQRSPVLHYSDHFHEEGGEVYNQACRLGLEGIISKRVDSAYEQKRSRSWVKTKCLERQEFVIGGYTDPAGARKGFGALLLGYYDSQGGLRYAGRVGTGFNETTLREIYKKLREREQGQSPFQAPAGGWADRKHLHWVAPELVAEVAFFSWTEEGLLRHPSFQGLREDKSPREIVREFPAEPPGGSDGEAREGERTSASAPQGGKFKVSEDQGIKIAGVVLSNPGRLLYPDQGITKQDLARYYEAVAEWILPYVENRPLTLVRCPDGYDKGCFFQKHINEDTPGSIEGIPIREKNGEGVYLTIRTPAGLISLVQMGVLEIHPWGSRKETLETPDIAAFDLDPGADVAWEEVVAAATGLKAVLEGLGLKSFLKTSGGKGLHIMVPFLPRSGWEEMKEFTRGVAERMVQRAPKKFVATMSRSRRRGKIFLDYVRNSRGATTVAPYSPRARSGAPVSTPVAWEELSPRLKPDAYTISNLLQRLKRMKKDPWDDFFRVRQSLTAEMKRAVGVPS